MDLKKIKLNSALLTSIASIPLLAWSLNATSAEYEVGQKDKQFTVLAMTIKQGDTVNFVNQDPFFHNVFSLSDASFFDLGSYPEGEFKTVTFDEKGQIEVECAIHPSMLMTIIVE